MKKNILIVGGAGFIGSHVVRLFVKKYPDYRIVNFDALTYAGNLENLRDTQLSPNYAFIKGDITNITDITQAIESFHITDIINLAAESHVDRSIDEPLAFVKTNVLGTVNLLNAALNTWKSELAKDMLKNDAIQGNKELTTEAYAAIRRGGSDVVDAELGVFQHVPNHLFYHISTDEVYGALGKDGSFTEKTPYYPHSPYSASKASSDHFVRAYHDTYGLQTIITNCSNNYGPNQFPEKLIPLFINNLINNEPLPVYGDGNYARDWLYVIDHAAAIDLVFHKGKPGETYNIGGNNEWKNIDLVNLLCDLMDVKLKRKSGTNRKFITFVKDRLGHDRRYAIDASKIKTELGWQPETDFQKGLNSTIDWYLENQEWLKNVTSGQYQQYYAKMYKGRD